MSANDRSLNAETRKERMFTFGRDHEKACSVTYLRDEAEIPRIHGVVDAVHDFLDATIAEAELRRVLYDAFSNGGSGVWDWLVSR